MPTLVAMTTLARFPRLFIHLPIMPSDSPPWCPGPHVEYTSAVSMKLNPAPTKALSTSIDRFSSIVQPKTFPPRQSVETFRPERPSIRSSIPTLLVYGYLGSLKTPRRGRDEETSPHRPVFRDVRCPAPAWQQRWRQGREGFP